MDRKEAVEIIKIERQCVERNTQNECDRDCANCDLLLLDEKIFAAYDMAIAALEEKDHRCSNCRHGDYAQGNVFYCLAHSSFHDGNAYCSEWEEEQ